MPIIINDPSKFIVGSAPQQQPAAPRPAHRPASARPAQEQVNPDGTRLYVNGKERKIGKKSQYLLDMLTLDD